MSGKAGDDGKNWLLIKHRDNDAARCENRHRDRKPQKRRLRFAMDEIAYDARDRAVVNQP